MPINEETLAKLTTALASDIELYNEVINTIQSHDAKLAETKENLDSLNQKLQESEERGQSYLGQISNLLSRIPVGDNKQNVSVEQKLEEIKNTKWTK